MWYALRSDFSCDELDRGVPQALSGKDGPATTEPEENTSLR